jgi:hypothetical protein
MFYRDRQKKDGRTNACKPCRNEARSNWQKSNPDKVRSHNLKSKYGLTESEFNLLLAKQDGKCAICGTTDPGRANFCVDHCHKHGHVRGLLCDHCNTAIGKFNDDPATIQRAIDYLNRF